MGLDELMAVWDHLPALEAVAREHADVLPSGDERLWQWPAGADPRKAIRTDRVKPLGRGDVGRHR